MSHLVDKGLPTFHKTFRFFPIGILHKTIFVLCCSSCLFVCRWSVYIYPHIHLLSLSTIDKQTQLNEMNAKDHQEDTSATTFSYLFFLDRYGRPNRSTTKTTNNNQRYFNRFSCWWNRFVFLLSPSGLYCIILFSSSCT